MIRLQLLLAVLVPAAFPLLPAAGVTEPLAVAVAVTATLAILLVAASVHLAPGLAAAPARVRAIALRERARRAVFLRLRDPDAAGHVRARAPSVALAAA